MIRTATGWAMFFEVFDSLAGRGKIGLAKDSTTISTRLRVRRNIMIAGPRAGRALHVAECFYGFCDDRCVSPARLSFAPRVHRDSRIVPTLSGTSSSTKMTDGMHKSLHALEKSFVLASVQALRYKCNAKERALSRCNRRVLGGARRASPSCA